MYNNTKRITISALLVALGVLLSRLISIPISLGGAYSFNIGFGMLPILFLCVLYGPVYGCLGALVWDLLGAIIFPKGAFVVWFTLAAGVFGFVTGAFFSKIRTENVNNDNYGNGTILTIYHAAMPATVKRIFSALVCGQFIYSVILNTLIITLLYSVPIKALIIPRILENIVMVFVNTALIRVLLTALQKTGIIPNRLPEKDVAVSEPCDIDSQKTVSIENTVETEPEYNSVEKIGLIGGYLCNGDYEKAKNIYDSVILQYRKYPSDFTPNQRQELIEFKTTLMKHLPRETFIIVQEAFDIDGELDALEQSMSELDTPDAQKHMDSLLNYFKDNRSMFSQTQLVRLRDCKLNFTAVINQRSTSSDS